MNVLKINPDGTEEIVQVEDVPCEESKLEQYRSLVVQFIREAYSQDDEFDVINSGINDPNDTAYLLYRSYVDDCKEKAHVEVYGND